MTTTRPSTGVTGEVDADGGDGCGGDDDRLHPQRHHPRHYHRPPVSACASCCPAAGCRGFATGD